MDVKSDLHPGPQPPLTIGQERVEAGEDKVVKNLVALQVAMMRSRAPKKRGQHGKQHGCADAEFVVRDDIPQIYRLGLFKESRSFKAVARLNSHGASRRQHHVTRASHGL